MAAMASALVHAVSCGQTLKRQVLLHELLAESLVDLRRRGHARHTRMVAVIPGNANERSERFQQTGQRTPAHDHIAVPVDERIRRGDAIQCVLADQGNSEPKLLIGCLNKRICRERVPDVGGVYAIEAQSRR